jgi:hypothetical protein
LTNRPRWTWRRNERPVAGAQRLHRTTSANRRRAAWLVLALGATLVVLVDASWRTPHAALFDGVIIEEPYRYLDPPLGEPGRPTSYAVTKKVPARGITLVAYTRGESPPQAQMFADRGALELTPGSRHYHVAITPIEAPAPPSDGTIAGNVYAMTVTDGGGAVATIVNGKKVTIALRAPKGTDTAATIRMLDHGGWQQLPTQPSGLPDIYIADTTSFGTFAVIAPRVAPSSSAADLGPPTAAATGQPGGSASASATAWTTVAPTSGATPGWSAVMVTPATPTVALPPSPQGPSPTASLAVEGPVVRADDSTSTTYVFAVALGAATVTLLAGMVVLRRRRS